MTRDNIQPTDPETTCEWCGGTVHWEELAVLKEPGRGVTICESCAPDSVVVDEPEAQA